MSDCIKVEEPANTESRKCIHGLNGKRPFRRGDLEVEGQHVESAFVRWFDA